MSHLHGIDVIGLVRFPLLHFLRSSSLPTPAIASMWLSSIGCAQTQGCTLTWGSIYFFPASWAVSIPSSRLKDGSRVWIGECGMQHRNQGQIGYCRHPQVIFPQEKNLRANSCCQYCWQWATNLEETDNRIHSKVLWKLLASRTGSESINDHGGEMYGANLYD